jgi:hypothetical protein
MNIEGVRSQVTFYLHIRLKDAPEKKSHIIKQPDCALLCGIFVTNFLNLFSWRLFCNHYINWT